MQYMAVGSHRMRRAGGRHKVMRQFSGNFWWTTAAYYRTLPDHIAVGNYIGSRTCPT